MQWSLAAYLFCFVVGLGLAIASGLGGHLFGGGHDVGAGHDFGGHDVGGHGLHVGHGAHVGHNGHDADNQPSLLSPPILSTFLIVFGFVGGLGERGLHLPTLIAAPVAAILGVVLAAAAFVALCRLFAVGQGTSHVSTSELVGREAEVITPIPADGVGEITYSVPTGRASCPARSESGVMIPKHSMVVITEVSGSTAMVRETVDEQLRKLAPEEDRKPESDT